MGGRVIAMVDNNFNFSFGEVIKAIRFRAFLRQKYDGFLVPGKSAKRLLMFYGVSERDIGTNLYSADSTIFANGMALSERLKRIVFVGQLCERKNVLTLLDAFVLSGIYKEGWTLSYFGSGPLRDELISRIAKQKMGNSVEVNAFKQPEQLAEEYRRSCGFVLPSVEEHWGLVVHEAALSGCLLLLSDCVGAAADLATERNAILFNPTVVSSIAKAFVKMTTFDNLRLKECQYESLRLARKISIGGFVESLQSLLEGQI